MKIWERIQALFPFCSKIFKFRQALSALWSCSWWWQCCCHRRTGLVIIVSSFWFFFIYGTSSHIANTMIRVQFDNFTIPAETFIICKVKILLEKPFRFLWTDTSGQKISTFHKFRCVYIDITLVPVIYWVRNLHLPGSLIIF